VKPHAGPPWSVTDDDDDRRQRPLLVWPPYTMCRWASNNEAQDKFIADIQNSIKFMH